MLKRILEYFSQSSIHGLHYITDSKRHISERLFWALVCTACVVGAGVALKGNVYNFQNNAVSFVMETTYLDWNITFPAISVCESESIEKIYDVGNRLYGEDRNMNIDFYLRDIAFYSGSCYPCSAHCGKTINCSDDFNYIVNKVRDRCDDLLGNCKINGVPFKCCRHFRRLQTEKGPCYTINSKHVRKSRNFPLDMTSNKLTGPGKLEFDAYEKISVMIHAPEDVPFINQPAQERKIVEWGYKMNMKFNMKEIENDPYVKQISISQRNCRFAEENYLKTYKLYSYSACVVDCRAQAMIKYCNCTHHFIPKVDGVKTCDLDGLVCLSNYTEILRSLRTTDYTQKLGLVCDCLSSCVEPEYTITSRFTEVNSDFNETIYGKYGSKISIEMDALPKEQFKRKVVRSPLELVVSMGGTIGFFLGASLLSIAEFFYYFLFRQVSSKPKVQQLTMLQNGKISQEVKEKTMKKKRKDGKQLKKIKYHKKPSSPTIPFLR